MCDTKQQVSLRPNVEFGMRGNGVLAGATARVARNGQMESDIRAIGRMTLRKDAGYGFDGQAGMVL